MIDFSKRIKNGTKVKKIDPVEIYNTLDRSSVTGPLRPVQFNVLTKWHKEYRNKKDLIIKLHTGAGKTLVGLLIALSYINNGEGPVVYVCPNIYLMQQVCLDAQKFGIPFCIISKDNEIPNDFLNGKRVLITYVQKVFNGLSIFGTGNQSIQVGCIILDDSHACIDSMNGSCTIQILYDTPAYQQILELVEQDLRDQGVGTFHDIINKHSNELMPIPYWRWQDRIDEITKIISKYTGDNHIKFAWPLLRDQLVDCKAYFSRVENFLSIKEKVVLSLLASKDNEHPNHLIADETNRYLKSAVIYGANASGKSNVLNAFWFMVNYVLTSHNQQIHKAIDRSPFKFDPETPPRPSSFEVIFTTKDIRYAYGFSVTDRAVTEEYLYYYPNGRKALIFERKNVKDFRFTVDIDEQNTLKERTSANKLYLSVASNWSYPKVIPVLEWFASCQIITKNSAADAYRLEAEQLKDADYRRAITSMLRATDFGIQALQMRDSGPALSQHSDIFTNIEAIHTVRDTNGNTFAYALNMAEESDGTNSYFKLIGVVKKTLDQGTLLVADDMDARLHPLLARHLVSLFDSAEFNPKGAQLIFTSHSTNLLDLDLLRRDQIWFTEKGEQTAATDLFSLYDFSVRKDMKVEKGYLIGRFGAIPFIKGWP